MYTDIRRVREHYAAIRELISQNDGGRDEPAARVHVALLCGAASAAHAAAQPPSI